MVARDAESELPYMFIGIHTIAGTISANRVSDLSTSTHRSEVHPVFAT
jgi:hypothetical protein